MKIRAYSAQSALKFALCCIVLQPWAVPPLLAKSEQQATVLIPAELRDTIRKNRVSEKELSQLQQILEKDPNNAEGRALLGQCYDIGGMRDMAKEQYDIANKLDPDRALGLLERFHAQFRDGDPADCLNDWIQIRKKYKDDPIVAEYENAIARIYGTVASAEEAAVDESAHGHNLRSVDAVLSIFASEKRDYNRAMILAGFELKKHTTDDAMLAKAMALNGLGKAGAAKVFAKACYGRNVAYAGIAREYALSCINSGNYSEAVEPALINLAVWEDPKNANEAKLLAIRAVKLAPNSVGPAMQSKSLNFFLGSAKGRTLNTNIAKILMEAGQQKQAQQLLAKAVRANNLDAEGYSMYATYLDRTLHDLEGAAQMYKAAAFVGGSNDQYALAAERLEQRIGNQKNDLAWRLKCLMRSK